MNERIEEIWTNRELLSKPESIELIKDVINQLDRGELRVATPPVTESDSWTVNEWVK
ncbi:MAG: 2,3,4,5-tetrahydropyridine-2,6-dicarboxylate N-succinyltransferase, partial [Flavobacterium sp.]